MTRFSKKFGGHGALGHPWLRPCQMVLLSEANSISHKKNFHRSIKL